MELLTAAAPTAAVLSFSAPLCGPKAFHQIAIEALGPSSRHHFHPAWCPRTRTHTTMESIPRTQESELPAPSGLVLRHRPGRHSERSELGAAPVTRRKTRES